MLFKLCSVVMVLIAASAQSPGQTTSHPGAEAALTRIALARDFGDLTFHSREFVTMAENPTVPGLNGLLFMRWKGSDPAMEITASVQWFEKTDNLLRFYRAEKARVAQGLKSINETVIWRTSDKSYLWTDGAHFVIGIGGRPAPSEEMLNAWLALIPSRPPDLAQTN